MIWPIKVAKAGSVEGRFITEIDMKGNYLAYGA